MPAARWWTEARIWNGKNRAVGFNELWWWVVIMHTVWLSVELSNDWYGCLAYVCGIISYKQKLCIWIDTNELEPSISRMVAYMIFRGNNVRPFLKLNTTNAKLVAIMVTARVGFIWFNFTFDRDRRPAYQLAAPQSAARTHPITVPGIMLLLNHVSSSAAGWIRPYSSPFHGN